MNLSPYYQTLNWITSTSNDTATFTYDWGTAGASTTAIQTVQIPIRRDLDLAPIYEPPPRGFNPFLNASDLLEDFIRYVGDLGVRQSEVLGLPIDLFIKWLILEAAKKDDDDPPEGVVVVIEQPRCLGCQRWMPKTAEARRVPFCASACLAIYSARRTRQITPPSDPCVQSACKE